MENIKSQLWNQTRIGGILYLVLIACGVYAEIFVLSDLIVGGNQTATAKNIVANEALYRTGIVAHIITLVCSSLLMGILFRIFKATSVYLAVTLVVFNIVAVAVECVSLLYEFETISILKSKALNGVFSPDQIHSLADLPLKMQVAGYDIALLFFGVVCCIISVLIHKSKLFPRWLGYMMMVAGICYLTNSLVSFISPGFRNALLPFILIPCFIAELCLSINMISRNRAMPGN